MMPLFLNLLGSAVTAGVSSMEAGRSRAFQREMRDTQYQAAMADMRKAGLNPILAYSQGGSSTNSAAQANPQWSGGGDVKDITNAMRVREEMKNMREERKRTIADADLKRSQSGVEIGKQRQQLLDREITEYMIPRFKTQARVDMSPTGQRATEINRYIQNVLGGFKALTGAARGMRR